MFRISLECRIILIPLFRDLRHGENSDLLQNSNTTIWRIGFLYPTNKYPNTYNLQLKKFENNAKKYASLSPKRKSNN